MIDVFNLTFDGLDLSKIGRDEAVALITNPSVRYFYVRNSSGKPMMEIQFVGYDILVDSEKSIFFGLDDVEIMIPNDACDAVWLGWYGRFKEDRIELSFDQYIHYFEMTKQMDGPVDACAFFRSQVD